MICVDDEVEINYDNSTFDDDDFNTFSENNEEESAGGTPASTVVNVSDRVASSGDSASVSDEEEREPIVHTFARYITSDVVTTTNIRLLAKQKLAELQTMMNNPQVFQEFIQTSAECGCGQTLQALLS
jgi:hypothetical protein